MTAFVRRAVRPVATLCTVLSLAGCGSRAAAPQQSLAGSVGTPGAMTDAAVAPSSAPTPASVSPAPEVEEPVASDDPAAASPPATRYRTNHNTNVHATIADTCVAPAEMVVAEISGPRNAGLTMVVSFSDNDGHGIMAFAKTDAAGRFTWRFPVPLDAPPGWATVLVNATGRDWNEATGEGGTEGGGTASARFQVAEAHGCSGSA